MPRRRVAVDCHAALSAKQQHDAHRQIRPARFVLAAMLLSVLAGWSADALAADPFEPLTIGASYLRPTDEFPAADAAMPVSLDGPVLPDPGFSEYAPWTWQLLPDGTLYESYLAGTKESRFQSSFLYSSDDRWLWDVTLGGRVGIVRFGPNRPVSPEGWQLEIDGAAYPRLDIDNASDVESVDFRFAIPLTYRRGPFAAKFGYSHISSHLGDEFLIRTGSLTRVNYSRDSVVLGLMYWLNPDLRAYSEFGYAFFRSGGAKPWEVQLGVDYSPAYAFGIHGAPFAGVNAHLREEVDFGGGLNLVAGWQWRGRDTDDLFRIGLQYYNGKSSQYSFFDEHEELFGAALWYDY